MIQVSVAEAQQRLPELLDRVRLGEIVWVHVNGDSSQLSIVPAAGPPLRPSIKGLPRAGRLKGKIILSDDFDEPLEELREYME